METRKYKSYVKSDEENKLNTFIGKRLKQIRNNRKITQTRLAKELNISFQQIGKYEKGQNGLNAIRLVELSTYLKVPYADLLPELLGEVKLPNDSSVSSHSESFENV